jgi:hypothetical protein
MAIKKKARCGQTYGATGCHHLLVLNAAVKVLNLFAAVGAGYPTCLNRLPAVMAG